MRRAMLWCAPLLAVGLTGCVGEANPLKETGTTVVDPGTVTGTTNTGTTNTGTNTGTTDTNTGTTGTGTTGTGTGTTGTGTTGTGTTGTTTGTSTTTGTTVTGTTPDGMYANMRREKADASAGKPLQPTPLAVSPSSGPAAANL